MRHRNQTKRAYRSPQSRLTDVEFELAFVATAQLVLEIDELENVNLTGGDTQAEGSDFYFEF